MDFEKNIVLIDKMKKNIGNVLLGKERQTEYVLAALLAGGHVLLEDVPGSGKTMLAKSLAKSVEADYSRVQFTPDLLPTDLLGLNYYNQKAGEFVFKAGPVFCNILLADEINRATPRTQSSLLECMEESQVTTDGITRELTAPFFVIATQNPIETVGTFPLPEAQLDRFMMKISVGLPDETQEFEIVKRHMAGVPIEGIFAVCSKEDIIRLQKESQEIYIHEDLIRYVVSIVTATRTSGLLAAGVSTRGTLAFVKAAKAFAMVKGRSFVTPEDVKELAIPVLAHRLVTGMGNTGAESAETILREIVDTVPVPTEDWSK